jgi:hypothetical protein
MDGVALLLFCLAWVLAGVKSSAMLVLLRTVLYAGVFVAPSVVIASKANGQRKRRRTPGKPAQTTAASAVHLEQPEAYKQPATEEMQPCDGLKAISAGLTVSCCSTAAADLADATEAADSAADAAGSPAEAAGSRLASLVSLQDLGAHAIAVVGCTAQSPACSGSTSSSTACSAACTEVSSRLRPAEDSSSAVFDTPISFPASCQPQTPSIGGSLDSSAWRTLLHPASCQHNAAASLGSSLDSAAWRTLLQPTGCQWRSLSSDEAAAAGLSGAGFAEQQLLQDRSATPSLFVCTSARQLSACQRSSSWKLAGQGAVALSGAGCDAMPLPSPAESPLARRVTNERDEHGFPTSPALLELLQQRAAAEAAAAAGSWDEAAEHQQVPWISVQLRAVPQQPSDEHSSGSGAAAANTSPPWLPLIIRHTSLDARSSSNDSSSPSSQLQHSKSTTAANGKATAAAAAAAAVAAAEAAAHKNRVAQLAAMHSAAAAAAAAGSARRDQRFARQLQDSGAVLSS